MAELSSYEKGRKIIDYDPPRVAVLTEGTVISVRTKLIPLKSGCLSDSADLAMQEDSAASTRA